MYDIVITHHKFTQLFIKYKELERTVSEIHVFELNPLEQKVARLGQIYRGKVVRVLAGLQAVFVDIGLEKPVYLSVNQLNGVTPETNIQGTKIQETKIQEVKIQEILHVGEYILVQVIKLARGEKAVQVSMQLVFEGRYFVVKPLGSGINISKKITHIDVKNNLLDFLKENLSQNKRLPMASWVIRTDAEPLYIAHLSDAKLTQPFPVLLEQDFLQLSQQLESFHLKKGQLKHVGLVFSGIDPLFQVISHLNTKEIKSVYIAEELNDTNLQQLISNYTPELNLKINACDTLTLKKILQPLKETLETLVSRRVALPCGGELVFDQTEAMMTIDVNSARFVGQDDYAESVLLVNLEASTAIAEQLRLRHVTGLIVIDFIDMKNKKHREQVFTQFKHCLAVDDKRTEVAPFSMFGLIEMTRSDTGIFIDKQVLSPFLME